MSDENSHFLYNLYENKGVAIVNLSGVIDSKASQNIEKLQNELSQREGIKCVILNFAQVESIGIEIIPAIAQLQKTIRSKPSELRMCSMKLSVKEKLVKSGVIRGNELAEDSKEAIYSLFAGKPRAA